MVVKESAVPILGDPAIYGVLRLERSAAHECRVRPGVPQAL